MRSDVGMGIQAGRGKGGQLRQREAKPEEGWHVQGTCLSRNESFPVTVGVGGLSEPDPSGYYMSCVGTWALSYRQYPREFSVMIESFYFLLSNSANYHLKYG